jgi:hypothetical protein
MLTRRSGLPHDSYVPGPDGQLPKLHHPAVAGFLHAGRASACRKLQLRRIPR